MKTAKNLRIYFLWILILLSSCGVLKNSDREFLFIQMTDPQFGFFSNNKGFSEETKLYEKAVAEINRIKPAFVVITGDLVNDRSNQAQWDEFRRITSLINPETDVYLTPGNHDIGQEPQKEDIDRYTSMFGKDRFSFRYHGCSFIGFNSSLIKAGTPGLEEDQFNWLRNELKSARRTNQTILFCHYPFFIKDPEEPETYSNIDPETRSRYLTLFGEFDVEAVFTGHLHNNAAGNFGATRMITTSAVGKPLGEAPSGFRIVQVKENEVIDRYFSLDKIPNPVVF
jgi:serine/threonine-protein phosphatase CPPED1